MVTPMRHGVIIVMTGFTAIVVGLSLRASAQGPPAPVAAAPARIDTVSGATYTSDGYRRSLQSALDAAHRAA